ncbi:MAG: site-specific integrase [Desulfovibrionaceae bacterium]|nr:site-specific integrase [Desulfovibrionaceae bacterium]
MPIYYIEDKGWRCEIQVKNKRYSTKHFKLKKEAKEAEAALRAEVKILSKGQSQVQTDITFDKLLELRLDYLQSKGNDRVKYYKDNRYMGRRWIREWDGVPCSQITTIMIEKFLNKRRDEYIKQCKEKGREVKSLHYALNMDIRCLKALFNYGISRGVLTIKNPVTGLSSYPVDKQRRYSPPYEDILKIISTADEDTADYLTILKDTLARVNEINKLTWDDVDFKNRQITLRTRKKKGGAETPRLIPMTNTVRMILKKRIKTTDRNIPWVFHHEYFSKDAKGYVVGQYKDRKKFMKTLCEKAGVKYFRFHGIRHSAASYLNQKKVPLTSIQSLLGHEKLTTTQIYLHHSPESLRDAIKLLEE